MSNASLSAGHNPYGFRVMDPEEVRDAIAKFSNRTAKMPTMLIKMDDMFTEAAIQDFDGFAECVALAPPTMRRNPQPLTSVYLTDSQLEIMYGAALIPMCGDYAKLDAQISGDKVIAELTLQKTIMMEGTRTPVLTWTATNCYLTLLDPRYDNLNYFYIEFQVRGTISVQSQGTSNDDNAGGQNASATDATAGVPSS